MAKGSAPKGTLAALNVEWQSLNEQHRSLVGAWASSHVELADCHELHDVLESVRRQPDPTLGRLLAMAAGSDPLAGRVVLQAMLGKLVRMARCDATAGLDEYVGALWVRIRTYPLTDRPRRIAANLALDTLKAVRQERAWLRRAEVTPYPPEAFLDSLYDAIVRDPNKQDGADHLTAKRVLSVAAELGLLSQDARSVLTSVYADGLDGRAAAARHGKTPGAIRVQCSSAVRFLARHAVELAEAA
jgi:DNA-directed RNA polymerase specialized sigma24 family protein